VTQDSATGDTSVIEIRPVRPQGPVLPGDNAALRKWVLRANPADGTLVLTEDRPFIITPMRRLNLALPSSGRADAVHTVCLVDNRWYKNMQTGVAWRPLFLNQEGRVLAKGRTRDEPKASQMWPLKLFTPLRALGVAVKQETYPSPKALRHAHPKA
jgi:hypothetical protein